MPIRQSVLLHATSSASRKARRRRAATVDDSSPGSPESLGRTATRTLLPGSGGTSRAGVASPTVATTTATENQNAKPEQDFVLLSGSAILESRAEIPVAVTEIAAKATEEEPAVGGLPHSEDVSVAEAPGEPPSLVVLAGVGEEITQQGEDEQQRSEEHETPLLPVPSTAENHNNINTDDDGDVNMS